MRPQLHRLARTRAALLVLALVPVLAALPAAADTLTQEIERTFRLEPGGEVLLKNVNGSITVETWDENRVEVKVRKKVKAATRAKAEEALQAFEIEMDSTPQRLRVEAKKPADAGGLWSWMRGGDGQFEAAFHLKIPRRSDLAARTVNGSVAVAGVEGRVEVDTVNGRVDLDAVTGTVDVSTTNGSVQVADARGRVSANTTNGAIEVSLAEVEAGADMSFSTTNGGVEVALPRDVRTHVKASTSNGGISTEFPVEVRGRVNKHLDGPINGGGNGRIEIRTTNGGIRLREI